MKWLLSKQGVVLFFLLMPTLFISLMGQEVKNDTVFVRDTVYIDRSDGEVVLNGKERKLKERWRKLIPSYSKVQFAGSMGLVSVGLGWNYGKNKQWETDVFYGFVPKYSTDHVKITTTLKQNFIPWTIRLNDQINLKPLSTGLYVNTIFGEEFWKSEPSKYPNQYYNFSTKLRLNVFAGQSLEYKINPSKGHLCKSVTFFYEISTNELYFISAMSEKYLSMSDILGLSLGLKFQFF